MATRKSSQLIMTEFGRYLPELVGGSADLKGSNLSYYDNMSTLSSSNPGGKYIYFGVREFAMSAIGNGLSLHGGIRPFVSTFLIFSEYAKNAIRMSALMRQSIIYIFSHDSIGLGEDGPTHQAVEQLASLRLVPNLDVWRPADTQETAVAWKHALLSKETPSALALSRQSLTELPKSNTQISNIEKGGYVLYDNGHNPDAIIISTGSEVELSVNAAEDLFLQNLNIRVVSMPCEELFNRQPNSYKEKCIPKDCESILVVEAAKGDSWYKYTGKKGAMITMQSFGLSGTGGDVMKHFGFTTNNIKKHILKLIKNN